MKYSLSVLWVLLFASSLACAMHVDRRDPLELLPLTRGMSVDELARDLNGGSFLAQSLRIIYDAEEWNGSYNNFHLAMEKLCKKYVTCKPATQVKAIKAFHELFLSLLESLTAGIDPNTRVTLRELATAELFIPASVYKTHYFSRLRALPEEWSFSYRQLMGASQMKLLLLKEYYVQKSSEPATVTLPKSVRFDIPEAPVSYKPSVSLATSDFSDVYVYTPPHPKLPPGTITPYVPYVPKSNPSVDPFEDEDDFSPTVGLIILAGTILAIMKFTSKIL